MTTSVRDDVLALLEKYEGLGTTQVPIEALQRILTEHPDPLREPLDLPQDADGSWPGDPRFAVQVRTIYGSMREVVVEAASLKEALLKAIDTPLGDWFPREDDEE